MRQDTASTRAACRRVSLVACLAAAIALSLPTGPSPVAATEVTATIPVEGVPVGTATSPDGRRLYVTPSYGDSLVVINPATKAIITKVAIGGGLRGVAVAADGSIYVTDYVLGTVVSVDPSTLKVAGTAYVGQLPYRVVASRTRARAYATNWNSGIISVLDTSTKQVVATWATCAQPYGIAESVDGARLYVTCEVQGLVSVVNAATGSETASIGVDSGPRDVAMSRDGKWLYVLNYLSGSVSVISTVSNAVVRNISVGDSPGGLAVTTDGSRLLVTRIYASALQIHSTATGALKETIAVGTPPSHPQGVSISPDGSKAYVANSNSNSVSIVDIRAKAAIGAVAVTGTVVAGKTIQAKATGVTGAPNPALTYRWQWKKAGGSWAFVDGATAASWTLPSQAVGRQVRVVVTASNGFGANASRASDPAPVKAA